MQRTDVKGLAEYLKKTGNGLSKSFIYKLVQEKQIPHKRVGNKIIFDIPTIEEWLSPDDVEPQEEPEEINFRVM